MCVHCIVLAGSCYYHDTSNFLVWAGAKNFLGMGKVSANNVYVNVESNGFKVCAVDDSPWTGAGVPAGKELPDIYANNTCITASGQMYHFSHCDPEKLHDTADNSYANTFMSPAAEVSFDCGSTNFSLSSYQAAGFEMHSVQAEMPSVAAIVALGRELLGIAPSL